MGAYAGKRKSINLKAMADIRDFVEGSKSFVQAVHKEAIQQAAWRLITYTAYGDPRLWKNKTPPKGYIPGMLTANWMVGIDHKPVGYNPMARDKQGYKTLAKMRFGRWTLGHTIYIVNNVPYAYRIETGTHSTQVPPWGMVGRVRKEWKSIVRQAVEDVKHTHGKTGSIE